MCKERDLPVRAQETPSVKFDHTPVPNQLYKKCLTFLTMTRYTRSQVHRNIHSVVRLSRTSEEMNARLSSYVKDNIDLHFKRLAELREKTKTPQYGESVDDEDFARLHFLTADKDATQPFLETDVLSKEIVIYNATRSRPSGPLGALLSSPALDVRLMTALQVLQVRSAHKNTRQSQQAQAEFKRQVCGSVAVTQRGSEEFQACARASFSRDKTTQAPKATKRGVARRRSCAGRRR